jgi:hypothetical protein
MALPRSMNITMNNNYSKSHEYIRWIFPEIDVTQTRTWSKNPTPPPFRASEKWVVTIGNIVTRHNSKNIIHYTDGRLLKGRAQGTPKSSKLLAVNRTPPYVLLYWNSHS